jgi:hypothetical protein
MTTAYKMLTLRVPAATQACMRAMAAVTLVPVRELIAVAFTCYYNRLPAEVRRQVDAIIEIQRQRRAV